MPEFTGVITEPGLYFNVPEAAYHGDPVPAGSLSGSTAKHLLDCPAVYDWHRKHPRATKEMDTGTVVHGILLGTGQEVAVLDFENRRTDKYKAAEKAAVAAGKVPMLRKDYAECEAVAQAVLDDDECAGLLAEGHSEVSMFWQDPEAGIWCRGRMDRYTIFGSTPTIVDVKTTADTRPDKFAKSIAEYRYDMQDWHYRDGLAAILGCHPGDIDFVFVTVPTSPPLLPMAYRLEDFRDVANAEQDCRDAREIWRDCTEANIWPKWSRDIYPIALPGYARHRIEEGINERHG